VTPLAVPALAPRPSASHVLQTSSPQPGNASPPVPRTPSHPQGLVSPATRTVVAVPAAPSTNARAAPQIDQCYSTVAVSQPAANPNTSTPPPPPVNPATQAAQAVPAPGPATAWHVPAPARSSVAVHAWLRIAKVPPTSSRALVCAYPSSSSFPSHPAPTPLLRCPPSLASPRPPRPLGHP
jgi:hypothetical protein